MTAVCCCLAFVITPSQSPPPPTADRLPPPPSPPPALLNDFDFSEDFATANFSGAVRGVVVLQRGGARNEELEERFDQVLSRALPIDPRERIDRSPNQNDAPDR